MKKILIIVGLLGAFNFFVISSFDATKLTIIYNSRNNRIFASYTNFLPEKILEIIHVTKDLKTGKIEAHSHVSSIADINKGLLLDRTILTEIRVSILEKEEKIRKKILLELSCK